MKNVVTAGLGIFFIFLTGCSHIPFIGRSASSPVPVKDEADSKVVDQGIEESDQFVTKGQVIDAKRLSSGGKVVILPFAAGVGVEASSELDKISLMIIKGISDILPLRKVYRLLGAENRLLSPQAIFSAREDNGKLFIILTDENAHEADLVIQGHITDLGTSSKLSRWVLFTKKKRLSVEGKMVETNSGKTVGIFSDRVRTNQPDEDFKALGYRVGQNIGKFILSGVKQD